MKTLRLCVVFIACALLFPIFVEVDPTTKAPSHAAAQPPAAASFGAARAVTKNRAPIPNLIANGALSTQPKLIESYYALPLSFEENGSPADPSERFLARGPGYSLFLTPAQASLVLERRTAEPSVAGFRPVALTSDLTRPVETSSIRLRLVGANASANMAGADPKPGRSNYFIGNDPAKWRTNVTQYGKVRMNQVYPGIDLVFYGNHQQLEYDFVVAPKADATAIRLQVDGAKHVRLTEGGDVEIESRSGMIRIRRPFLYQGTGAEKKPVAGSFEISRRGVISLSIGPYDRTQSLVIDPVLSYSEVLDSGGSANVTGVAVDANGNAYVTGNTCGPDFPTTPGNFTTQHNPFGDVCYDVIVLKFNPTASSLIFSDVIGGSEADTGTRLALDSQNNVYVTGATSSSDFPTTAGALVPSSSFPGGACMINNFSSNTPCFDGFAFELSADGSTLDYSTLLGGSQNTLGTDIKVDANGQAYVMGATNSADFKPTPSGLQTTFGGGTCSVQGTTTGQTRPCFDAFLVVLSTDGTQAKYSTFFGGSDDDDAVAMAMGNPGDIYFVGGSSSSNLPFTTTIPPSSGSAGSKVAYAAEINTAASPASSGLVYAIALQGSQTQGAAGITLDSLGNAYITGATSSSNFPVKNALQPTYQAASQTGCTFANVSLSLLPAECGNAFVAGINPAGTSLLFSTFLGGTGPDGGAAIAYDPGSNSLWITGFTSSENFPTTPDAYYSNSTGAFLSNLSADGSQNIFTTLLNQNGFQSGGVAVTVDGSGGVYVVGLDGNYNAAFPITPGVYPFNTSTTPATFLVKFSPGAQPIMQYSPNSIAFPSIAIGGSSSQSVMVQNTGAAPMQISVQMGATSNDGFTPGPTPNFVESDNCGSSLAASAVCTIQVTFEPAPPASDQGGPNRFATLTIFDNAPGDAHTVTLTGQAGNGPVLAVPTAPIVFPSQAAGTSSQPLPVLVSNLGDVPLNITNLSLGGANPSAFSVNLNPSGGSEAGCGAAPTSSVCEITVTFNPSAGATGTLSATALFTDNAADTPQNISISGAVAGSVALNISPTTLPVQGAFPDAIGNPIPQGLGTFAVTNPTANSVQVTALTFGGANPGDYAVEENSCSGITLPFTVAPGASCSVGLSFQPAAGPSGTRSATLALTTSPAISGLPSVLLQADAVSNTDPSMSIARVPIDAGGVVVGHTLSDFGFVQIFNNYPIPCAGGATTCGGPLNITSITPGLSDFVLSTLTFSPYCTLPPLTIPAGGNCAFFLSFTPAAAGSRNTQLTILSNDPQGAFSVPVVGSGISVAIVRVSPAMLNFGPQVTGITSQPSAVTLSNIGSGNLTVSSITPSANFAISSNTCAQPVAPNTSCTFSVTVTPPASGNVSGSINILDNGAYGGQQTVTLSASGTTGPALTLSPMTIQFGDQVVNTASAPQTITLSSTGNATVTFPVNGIHTTEDFIIAGTTCGASLAPGASCTISVEYKPSVEFFETGSLLVSSNAPGSPQPAYFNGLGITVGATATTTALVPSLNPANVGQSVTFVATVNSPGAATTPTGTVEYFDGATEIGSAGLNGVPQAMFATSALAAGTHSITAMYQGDGTFAASTSPVLMEVINGSTAATALTYSGPTTFTNGSAANPSAVLMESPGGGPVAGVSVLFTLGSGGTAQTCSGTTNSAGTATCSISSVNQTAGSSTISASFAGNASFLASSVGPVSVTISGGAAAATTLTYNSPTTFTNGSAANPSATLTQTTGGGPVAGVSVLFTLGSGGAAQTCSGTTNSAGTATCSISSVNQTAGSSTISASFAGNSSFLASSAGPISVTISAAPAVATTLTYNGPTTFTNGSAANPSAILTQTAGGSPVASVSVLFTLGSGGAAQTCSGTTNSAGAATCSITTVNQTAGSSTISASFAGNSNFLASSAGPATITIVDFTISSSTGAQTVPAGTSAMYAITTAPVGGAFTGMVTFTASGLPTGATATFNPSSVTPGTGTTMTIATTARTTTTAAPSPPSPRGLKLPGSFPVWIAFLGLAMLLAGVNLVRSAQRPVRRFASAVALILLLVTVGFLSGCVGGSPKEVTTGTPAGTYTITVTGTSGSAQHSTTVSLTVQ